MAGKYRLTTLGCKVNQYESQQIRELFDSLGMRPVRNGEAADIAVVNTCAVTAGASSKSRRAIRRAARDGRTPVVIVGCGAAAEATCLSRLNGVIAVIGHRADVPAELKKLVLDSSQPASPACREAAPGNAPGPMPRVHRLDATLIHPASEATNATQATLRRPDVERNDVWMIPLAAKPGRPKSASRTTSSPSNIISPQVPVVKAGPLRGTIRRFAGRQRAFLKVQDGCDARCTYCIIPRLRPSLRSKPVHVAVAEAENLVRSGHKEIIVSGIFLGAYGLDTAVRKRFGRCGAAHGKGLSQNLCGTGFPAGHNGSKTSFAKGSEAYGLHDSARAKARGSSEVSPLATLVDALAQVPGLARLRLSSLEPGDLDESLLSVLASHETCVPHLHLPLQSGSERILGRMNRQYTRQAFIEMVDRVRTVLDRPAITTDIIVGFPGETEGDFQASLDVARDAGFLKIHAFPFSPREGTVAARWRSDFVHPGEVHERMNRLAELERACSLAYRRSLLGRTEHVIVEEPAGIRAAPDKSRCRNLCGTGFPAGQGHEERACEKGYKPHATQHGRADRYFEVCFEAENVHPGDLVSVRLDGVTATRTRGTYLPPDGVREQEVLTPMWHRHPCGTDTHVAPVFNR